MAGLQKWRFPVERIYFTGTTRKMLAMGIKPTENCLNAAHPVRVNQGGAAGMD